MKAFIQRIIIGITTLLLVVSCSNQKESGSVPSTSSSAISSSAPNSQHNNATSTPSGNEPNISQAPFSLPEGYQAVETTAFKFAVPKDWKLKKRGNTDIFDWVFQKDDKDIGETETLGWFDSETWKRGGFKPNHSDQTDFQKMPDMVSIKGLDVHVFKIQLIHTKPAADLNPNWKYSETRWYITVKEKGLSYGFYFSSDDVEESTMKTIVSSFRLKNNEREK